jgi:hypothetical protein
MINLFNWVEKFIDFFTLGVGGGSKGGGGGGNSTQTSYSTNLPEYAKPFYEELLKQTGKQVYSTDTEGNVTGVNPYTPYTGERVAAFSPGQTAVQGEVAGMKTPGQFGSAASGLNLGQTMGFGAGAAGLGQAFSYDPSKTPIFSRSAASYYADPYASGVTDIAVREAERKGELDKTAGALGAINRGTFGGARNTLMQAEQQRNLNQNIGDIRAKGAEQAYQNAQQQFNADVNRQQQAQQYGASLGSQIGLAGLQAGIDTSGKQGALGAAEQTANLERLKAQAASAGEQQAYQQQIDDLKYQQFMDQQNYQKSQLDYLSQILRGNAAALGTTQVSYAPAPSLASQLGGVGLAGLGLYNVLNKG